MRQRRQAQQHRPVQLELFARRRQKPVASNDNGERLARSLASPAVRKFRRFKIDRVPQLHEHDAAFGLTLADAIAAGGPANYEAHYRD